MPKKVLIVEDYEDSLSFMKFLVESYGHQVIEAKDGIQAVDLYKQQHPDLILMDMSLPTIDGLTTTRVIRELDGAQNVPIIAVTAFGKLYHQRALEAGCDELINKPVDFDTIESVLTNYLLPAPE